MVRIALVVLVLPILLLASCDKKVAKFTLEKPWIQYDSVYLGEGNKYLKISSGNVLYLEPQIGNRVYLDSIDYVFDQDSRENYDSLEFSDISNSTNPIFGKLVKTELPEGHGDILSKLVLLDDYVINNRGEILFKANIYYLLKNEGITSVIKEIWGQEWQTSLNLTLLSRQCVYPKVSEPHISKVIEKDDTYTKQLLFSGCDDESNESSFFDNSGNKYNFPASDLNKWGVLNCSERAYNIDENIGRVFKIKYKRVGQTLYIQTITPQILGQENSTFVFTNQVETNTNAKVNPTTDSKYNNALDLNSVAVLLKDEIASRVEKVLGKPDVEGQYDNLGYAGKITYAVYYNKVKTKEGLQNLVLIARNLDIIGIFSVEEGGIVKAGKERTWIIVKQTIIEYNNAWAYGGGKYQKFNTTTKFGSY